MSQAGSNNAGAIPPGTIPVINIPGATFNANATGVSTCFTTGNSSFFATTLLFTNITYNGSGSNFTYNLGWTGPTYTDIKSDDTYSWSTQGSISFDSAFQTSASLFQQIVQ